VTNDGLDQIAPDPDSEGCRCVVASFVSAASLVERVSAEAAKRIMMSPTTGDFVEMRFASLGPQQGPGDGLANAVRRVTDEILNPPVHSGRNHFALVVIDKSAATAEEVLTRCAAEPFLARLRLRLLGIASNDDRLPGDRASAQEPGSFWEIVVSPSGAWRRESDLVDVLRHYGDELLSYFSAQQLPGLSLGELAVIKSRYQQYSAQGAAAGAPAPSTTTDNPGPESDLLEAGTVVVPQGQAPAQADREDDHQPRLEQAEEEPEADENESAAAAESAAEKPENPDEQDPAQPAERPVSFRSRWLPGVYWPRGNRKAADEAGSAEPVARALVYLLIAGDGPSADHAAWERSRAALLEADRKFAAAPGVACLVRALQGDEGSLAGELREAGRLTRRSVKRPVTDADFAAVLEKIRGMLRRDRALVGASEGAEVRAAIVIFAPDPPLVDPATVEVFAELTREALVTWVVPKESEGLLTPALGESAGAQVHTDYEAVAEELVDQFRSDTDAAARA